MQCLAQLFVLGFCVGLLFSRRFERWPGALALTALLLLGACAAAAAVACRPPDPTPLVDGLAPPVQRAWTLEQRVSEGRRMAFNGQVGSDGRLLRGLACFARCQWECHVQAVALSALHWLEGGLVARVILRRLTARRAGTPLPL